MLLVDSAPTEGARAGSSAVEPSATLSTTRHPEPPLLPLLVLTALTAVGLTFAVLGARRYGRSRRWPRTTGTVTGSRMGTSSGTRDGGAVAPRVRFTVQGGRVLEVTSSVSDDLGSYRCGRELPVRYDPQDPEHMVVDTAAQNGLVMGLLGLVLTGVGGTGLLAVVLTR